MLGYILTLLFFYAVIVLLQLPWWFLFAGAWRRLRQHGGRLRRIQMEGAVMVLVSVLGLWAVFDSNLGIDRLHAYSWSFWFERGMMGLFWIGLSLVGLGYFLERRPRPGLQRWPRIGKMLSAIGILSGIAVGMTALIWFNYQWFELPWRSWYAFLTLGCYPFTIGYFVFSRQEEPPVIND